MKSEGVKDMVKWLEAECKKAKQKLDDANAERKGAHWANWDMLDRHIVEAQKELDVLVRIKISTEKYMKKLKHEGQ